MDLDEMFDEVVGGAEQVEPASYASKPVQKRGVSVPVDDDHPFDLESFMATYTGPMAIHRLIHIANHSPTLAPAALQSAIQSILLTSNTLLYGRTVQDYNALTSTRDAIPIDQSWIEEVSARNAAEKNRLEVELKQYTSNMIKESIRMGHRDLGDFYRSTGDYNASLKSYTKSREFCTTSQHVIEMCTSALQLLIEQRYYAHISTYVFKAEAALDAAGAKNESGPKSAVNINAICVRTRLDFSVALGHLGLGNYAKAAYGFLKLGHATALGDWLGTLVAPGDIAIYGTLCALACLPRSGIQANLLGNAPFGFCMEQEPHIREMIDAYMSSKFKTVLELLERYSTRHFLDVHLSPHVNKLTALIRDRALVLYFQPFQSIRLERMGEAFGMDVEEIERQVVRLIQTGGIQARVDSRNKILQARNQDARAATLAMALATGKRIQESNRKLLFRMKLMQADLVVRAPKGQVGSSQRHEASVHEILSG